MNPVEIKTYQSRKVVRRAPNATFCDEKGGSIGCGTKGLDVVDDGRATIDDVNDGYTAFEGPSDSPVSHCLDASTYDRGHWKISVSRFYGVRNDEISHFSPIRWPPPGSGMGALKSPNLAMLLKIFTSLGVVLRGSDLGAAEARKTNRELIKMRKRYMFDTRLESSQEWSRMRWNERKVQTRVVFGEDRCLA